VIAGSVGGGGRQTYSLYGDTVNLAARLEALNKEHGTQVLIDAATAAHLGDVPVQEIGRVAVRGFSAPAAVFAPVPETGAKLGLGAGPGA
jgi:class 3 adenylate cyclase